LEGCIVLLIDFSVYEVAFDICIATPMVLKRYP
jgi:hypothetical protein